MVEVDDDTFAILVSMSHIFADGYTAYAIMNILLVPDSITALDPYRDHTFNEKLKGSWSRKNHS